VKARSTDPNTVKLMAVVIILKEMLNCLNIYPTLYSSKSSRDPSFIHLSFDYGGSIIRRDAVTPELDRLTGAG